MGGQRETSPRDGANIVSLLTFFFTYKTFQKGYSARLEEGDIYEVPLKLKSSVLGECLEKKWKEGGKQRSALWLLWGSFGKKYFLLGLLRLALRVTFIGLQPQLLGKFISCFTESGAEYQAVYYALGLIGLNVGYCFFDHNYMFLVMELSVGVRTAFGSLIFRKSVRLSSASSISLGRIVTLLTKDMAAFDIAVNFLNDAWISVILLVLCSIRLYSQIGLAALTGVVFLLLTVPIQSKSSPLLILSHKVVFFGKLVTKLRVATSGVTDRRIFLTQEALSAIRTIKMYTWEKIFAVKIAKTRDEEVARLRKIYFLKAASLVLGTLGVNLTFFVIVVVQFALGGTFTAETAVFLHSSIKLLHSFVIIALPAGIAQVSELLASSARIDVLLNAPEHQLTRNVSKTPAVVELKNISCKLQRKTIIPNLDLDFHKGLTLITGRVASGKSSLLRLISGDYVPSSGGIKVHGMISHVTETPWLFPATIKQNILFGQKYHQERYKKVLEICALGPDLATFQNHDETIIEDNGLNLSKGQQSRVNLARAVYQNSDIYLLDNCLASLDPLVQDFIFRRCIKEYLGQKIVVMVSNNQGFIDQANSVLSMDHGVVKTRTTTDKIQEREEDTEVENVEMEEKTPGEDEDELLLPEAPLFNIYSEEKQNGGVYYSVYQQYLSFGGGYFLLILLLTVFGLAQAGTSVVDKIISNWVTLQQKILDSEESSLHGDNRALLEKYGAVLAIATILVSTRALAHFSFVTKSARMLHKAMLKTVLGTKMEFFDLHFLGNILNRFSKDTGTVDEYLPFVLYEYLKGIWYFVGVVVLIGLVNKIFLLLAVVLFVVLFAIRRLYLLTGRNLKRLEAATKSPVLGHVNATYAGLPTIRSSGMEEKIIKDFDDHQDLYTSAFYMSACASQAFAFAVDFLSNLFLAKVFLAFVFIVQPTEIGNVMLAINQAILLRMVLHRFMKQWGELETTMVSVERLAEYCSLEPENITGQIATNWPKTGQISFTNLTLSYPSSKSPALKNLTFRTLPMEKIAVVGRTGAGKTSLVSTLFRFYPYTGTVTIDGVDIKTIALDFLRANIAIIPQDPILFKGTIRSNIDPGRKHTDEELWHAIKTLELCKLVPSLEHELAEYSSGQKQLLCLVRAMISRSKIIVLDEATSDLDSECEQLLYRIINSVFAECTVLMVVHRLYTALQCDRIVIVRKGQIVEVGPPRKLLKEPDSIFYHYMQKEAP